jgi:hypothetical protein
MQTFKVIGWGLLFSFLGSIGYLLLTVIIGILRGEVTRNQAIGLGAFIIGLKDATLFNPIYWLVIAVAFGLAFWITGKPHAA